MSTQDTQTESSTGLQSTFGDGPTGEHVSLATDGRVIRPLLAIPGALVSECRWHFDAEGVHMAAVDPPNVSMVGLTVNADAFEKYELSGGDEVTTACVLKRLRKPLANVRYGTRTADPVALTMDRTQTTVTTSREYDHSTLERSETFLNLDPDSVRQDAEQPELEYDWKVMVDVDAWADLLDAYNADYDYVSLRESDGALVVEARNKSKGDTVQAAQASFDGEIQPAKDDPTEGVESFFGLHYQVDIASALKRALVDQVTVEWAEEFPCRLTFTRERDGQELYSGWFLQAPRISSD